jgi:hypothetical protein
MIRTHIQLGINNYGGGANLRGCLNDLDNFNAAIQRHALSISDRHTYKDKQATTNQWRTMLNWVPKLTSDVIIFQNSSHGSTLPDDNSDELISRIDQCFVPQDYARYGFIRDDLNGIAADALAAKGKDQTIVWIADSCFSGNSQRLLPASITPFNLRNRVKRAFSLDLDRMLPASLITAKAILATGKRQPREIAAVQPVTASLDPNITYNNEPSILIACARANETAADAVINGKPAGAGTWALIAAWDKLGIQATYEQVVKAANSWLTNNSFAQRIQLQGRSDKLKRVFLT